MKLVLALFLTFCVDYGSTTIKCNTGTDAASLSSGDCADTDATTCTSPMFVEYTGMSDQAYGCGLCGEAKGITCEECIGEAASACNNAVESQTFECYGYTYDSETKKFKANTKATTCNALKTTAIKCNSPGESAESDYKQANGGCGPCAADTIEAKTCEECKTTGCNSATALTFVLAPLLAVLYCML